LLAMAPAMPRPAPGDPPTDYDFATLHDEWNRSWLQGSRRNLVSTLERDLTWDRAIFNLKVPDEAEAGSAGTQLGRGIIRWAHREDEKRGRAAAASRPRRASAHRTIDPHALKNPGVWGLVPKSIEGAKLPSAYSKPAVLQVVGKGDRRL
jgi:hypothetical protein